MGMFDQAKDLYKLQKQAKQIKKKLKNLHIEAEVNGIVIVINAEMEVISVTVSPERLAENDPEKLNSDLKEAFNKAMKKAQEVAAEHMRELMGGMGMDLPGMTA